MAIFDNLDEIGNRIRRVHAAQLYRKFLEIIPSTVLQSEAKSQEIDSEPCPTCLQSLRANKLEEWFDNFAVNHSGIEEILTSGQNSTQNLLHAELENASFLIRNDDEFRFAYTSFFEFFLASALLESLQN